MVARVGCSHIRFVIGLGPERLAGDGAVALPDAYAPYRNVLPAQHAAGDLCITLTPS